MSFKRPTFPIWRATFLGLAWLGLYAASSVQAQSLPEPRNIVQLSSSGAVEALQDLLTVTLSASKDGNDADSVQSYLRQATEMALTEVKKSVLAGSMDVRTGAFSLQPRYGKDGKITGWTGSTELVLEGTDFARIGAAASKAAPLTIRHLNFSLSRAARTALEEKARKLAIESFRSKAADIAKDFGFQDYVLREVSVSSVDQGPGPRPRMMAMAASMADMPSVPMESGNAVVLVTVSGAVQLK